VIWIAIFAAANVALAFYAPVLTSFVNQIPGRDKTAHFVVMGLFGALVTLSVRDRRARIGSFAIPVGIPLVIVLVTLEEVSQIWLVHRRFAFESDAPDRRPDLAEAPTHGARGGPAPSRTALASSPSVRPRKASPPRRGDSITY
jgi:hypothetical protein